jgi:hypothetical protein
MHGGYDNRPPVLPGDRTEKMGSEIANRARRGRMGVCELKAVVRAHLTAHSDDT